MIKQINKVKIPRTMDVLAFMYSILPNPSFGRMLSIKTNTSYTMVYKIITFLEKKNLITKQMLGRTLYIKLTPEGVKVAESCSIVINRLK